MQSLPNLTGFLTIGTTACLTALGITIAKLAQHPVPGVRGFSGAKMPVNSLPQIAAWIQCMLRRRDSIRDSTDCWGWIDPATSRQDDWSAVLPHADITSHLTRVLLTWLLSLQAQHEVFRFTAAGHGGLSLEAMIVAVMSVFFAFGAPLQNSAICTCHAGLHLQLRVLSCLAVCGARAVC